MNARQGSQCSPLHPEQCNTFCRRPAKHPINIANAILSYSNCKPKFPLLPGQQQHTGHPRGEAVHLHLRHPGRSELSERTLVSNPVLEKQPALLRLALIPGTHIASAAAGEGSVPGFRLSRNPLEHKGAVIFHFNGLSNRHPEKGLVRSAAVACRIFGVSLQEPARDERHTFLP